MKVLLYALALQGCGTRTLARALAAAGLPGGHEVFGQGMYGSATDVPNFLRHGIYTKGYNPPEEIGGFTGDGFTAAALFKLYKTLRTNTEALIIQPSYDALYDFCFDVVRKTFERYLDGSGCFFSIGQQIAEWWPIIDIVFPKRRCIHLTQHGKYFVQRAMTLNMFSNDSIKYGPEHVLQTIYPPLPTTALESDTRFELVCKHWTEMNEWFLMAEVPTFHVEDFNNEKTALNLFERLTNHEEIIVTPEAQADFIKALHSSSVTTNGHTKKGYHKDYANGFEHPDNWNAWCNNAFNSVCGKTMKKLRYTV